MTNSIEIKEALQDAANNVLTCDGVSLGKLTYTRKDYWRTIGGTVEPPVYEAAFEPSAQLKQALTSNGTTNNNNNGSTEAEPQPADSKALFGPLDLGWKNTPEGVTVSASCLLDDGTSFNVTNIPLGLSPVKMSDGKTHEALTFVNYGNGLCVENCWMNSPGNYRGDLTIQADGKTIFNGRVHFGKGVRPRIQRFGKQFPATKVHPDSLPDYDPNISPTSYINRYRDADNSINGLSLFTYPHMGTGGMRHEIAPIPGSDVPWHYNQSEDNETVLRGFADAAGVQPVHFRDPETGLPVSIQDHPSASTLDAVRGDGDNPIKDLPWYNGPYTPNVAHLPGMCIMAYLATNDNYYADELAFWANHVVLSANMKYRGYERGYVTGSPRKRAWGLRSIAAATYFLPDGHPQKQYFATILDWNWRYLHGIWIDQGERENNLGVIARHATAYGSGRCAPWQDDYFTYVMDWLTKLDPEKWQAIRDYKATFSWGRMTQACYQGAALYTWKILDEQGNVYETFEEAYVATVGTNNKWTNQECGSFRPYDNKAYEIGDMTGYPWSPIGYPAIMQPALAAAVNAGLPGAQEGWQKFINLPTRPDWSSNAAYAIVPTM